MSLYLRIESASGPRPTASMLFYEWGCNSACATRAPEESAMRRRSFVAALSLAAVSTTAFAQTAPAAKRTQTRAPDAAAAPGYQAADAIRFERPDVHAGDRPVGASFASRSAALGVSGAAGTAHPLATLTAIEILKRGGTAVDGAVRVRVHQFDRLRAQCLQSPTPARKTPRFAATPP
jgi:hypothetical protein